LRKEIKLYDPEVAGFDWLVVANKMDLEGAEENLAHFRARFPKVMVIPISAEQEEGLEVLREELDQRVGYRKDQG
jgi:GTP-binding protein